MILYIDTQDQKTIRISFKEKGKIIATLSEKNSFGSQVLLPLILKLLKQKKLDFTNLKGIEVEKGPGSFTGIRVGVSVANALGFSLGISVNRKEAETELIY